MSDPSKVARKKRKKMKYNCTDGNADVEIEAETAQQAAQEYADGGDWGDYESTIWIDVQVADECGEIEQITIALDPPEPKCSEPTGHDWRSPYSVVGGIKDNPGVWGHGGGVVITSVCKHCGCYVINDTWAQNPDNGEQGLKSTQYKESDEESLAWVKSQQEDATSQTPA